MLHWGPGLRLLKQLLKENWLLANSLFAVVLFQLWLCLLWGPSTPCFQPLRLRSWWMMGRSMEWNTSSILSLYSMNTLLPLLFCPLSQHHHLSRYAAIHFTTINVYVMSYTPGVLKPYWTGNPTWNRIFSRTLHNCNKTVTIEVYSYLLFQILLNTYSKKNKHVANTPTVLTKPVYCIWQNLTEQEQGLMFLSKPVLKIHNLFHITNDFINHQMYHVGQWFPNFFCLAPLWYIRIFFKP